MTRSQLLALLLVVAACCVRAQDVTTHVDAWVDESGGATIGRVASGFTPFRPAGEREVFPLGGDRALWLRVRIVAPAADRLSLDIPVPLIDDVTLFQREPRGAGWSRQEAGDHRAVSAWFRPGRYPSFDIQPATGTVRTVFLQVRHADPIGFELRVTTAAQAEQRRLYEYLVLGVLLGCLVLFTAACATQAVLTRQVDHVMYAVYAAAMTLTIATVTGVAGHLLWGGQPDWADAAQGALPVMIAGIHLIFLQHLCATYTREPWLARTVNSAGVLLVVLGVLYPWANPQLKSVLVSTALVLGACGGLAIAWRAWRRHHDVVGGWVLLAYAPLAAVVVVVVLRLYGFIAASWLSLDASAGATALAVPLLLLALSARSREWHRVETRMNLVTELDALTGLMSARAFEKQLDRAVAGALMRREAAAVILVEISNLRAIRRAWGDAMAEQALLRAAMKLHRVVRESDPAGRVDTARFAVILEGMRSRSEVRERMVRLVASGLVPARGARLEVPLRMHVACLMLGEGVYAASIAMRKLQETLATMSPRTRRPVRFLEAISAPVPLEEEAPTSSFDDAPPSETMPMVRH